MDHPMLVDTSSSTRSLMAPVGLTDVKWLGGIWQQKCTTAADVSLDHLYRLMSDPERGHAVRNMEIAAGRADGDFAGTHWQDEWVYKWIESAALVLAGRPNPELDHQIDDLIELIGGAQQPDGYLATQITVRGWERFQTTRHHELYVMGHLITAAVVHHRVTGKPSLLDIAIKTADFLYRTFIDPVPEIAHFGKNPSYVMALVELYRCTGDRRYLDLAGAFINRRGTSIETGEPEILDRYTLLSRRRGDNNQDCVPLREETEVVGHMVFATYLYAGATDVFLETGDESLWDAVTRLWEDLTTRKMYIHGGVGAQSNGVSIRGNMVTEAADAAYVLPSSRAYNETCAQIGNFMWNWRMLLATGDAQYADIMELSIFNSILSGVDLSGRNWFYTNVLQWNGPDHQRSRNHFPTRFEPAVPPDRSRVCCPTNLLRTLLALHSYSYSLDQQGIWVHLYGHNRLETQLPDGSPITLEQTTDYPWDGRIRLTLEQAPDHAVALRLRIPEWVDEGSATLEVNGAVAAGSDAITPGSYVVVKRTWRAGDVIELQLPMPARIVTGNPLVEEVRGQGAVMRGPLVYCLESPDLPAGVRVRDVRLPAGSAFQAHHDHELLDGVTSVDFDGAVITEDTWNGQLYRPLGDLGVTRHPIKLIPYYSWANRGESEMSIWLPLEAAVHNAEPHPKR